MEVQFQLSKEDAEALLKRGQKPVGNRIGLGLVVLIVALAVASFFFSQNLPAGRAPSVRPVGQSSLPSIVSFFAPIGLFVLFWVFFLFSVPKQQSTALANSAYFQGTHKVSLSDEAFHHENQQGGSFARWQYIHEVSDTETHIFVLTDANQGHVIPKRAFSDPATAAAFSERVMKLWRDQRVTSPIANLTS